MGSKDILYSLLVKFRQLHRGLNVIKLRLLLQHVGVNTEIDPSFWFEDPQKIYISDRVQIRKGVVMLGRTGSETGIYLGEGSHIKEYAYLDAYGGHIRLGREVRIGHHCVIAGHGGINFKDWAGVAGLSYVISGGRRYENTDIPVYNQEQVRESIVIGERAWLGCGVSILDGVTIGDGSVVGAGSVVTDPVPPYCVAWGVPAKVQRYLKSPSSI